jgi:monoterpene epsilon-lactone hydrolase
VSAGSGLSLQLPAERGLGQLPAERGLGQLPTSELTQRRTLLESRAVPQRAGIEVSTLRIAGVGVVECLPERPESTFVYLHGGGFRLGSARAWTGLGLRLAAECRARVLIADYRLAPEDPFPAALRDVIAVLAEVLTDRRLPVIVGGDSAGGGLAAAAVAAFAGSDQAAPDGLVCLSGWFDLTVTSPSYLANAELDAYFSRFSAQEAAASYLQGWEARDPWASPLFGELAGFPPVLLFASTAEVLLEDTLSFSARLARAHVPVRTVLEPGRAHAWPVIQPDSRDTTAVLAAIEAFSAGLASRSVQPTTKE